MNEPVTFISWCMDANSPLPAGKFPAPTVPANAAPESPAPATAKKTIPLLWPSPVRYGIAALILVGSAILAFQLWRTAQPHADTNVTMVEPVDLNRATAAELSLLPGIGPKVAERIVEYRERMGRFSRVDDLRQVPGIGPVNMERLRLRVTVYETVREIKAAHRPVEMVKPPAANVKNVEIVDVNRAGAAELCKIPGIKTKLAQNILECRAKHGPFRVYEDLCKVKGIKAKMLEKIKPYITLDGDLDAQSQLP